MKSREILALLVAGIILGLIVTWTAKRESPARSLIQQESSTPPKTLIDPRWSRQEALNFDEIDQGIGGRVGAVVGQKLWNLGREHQVLCITHLPQLAGFGEQHFKVDKVVEDGRTITKVHQLSEEGRLMELAQMLGEVSEGTLQSAHEILQSVREATSAAV